MACFCGHVVEDHIDNIGPCDEPDCKCCGFEDENEDEE